MHFIIITGRRIRRECYVSYTVRSTPRGGINSFKSIELARVVGQDCAIHLASLRLTASALTD